MKPLQEIVLNQNFSSVNPKIRALDYDEESRKILIGTRGGEIVEFDTSSKEKKFLLQGHFDQELWGMATHPSRDEFVTVGEDFLLAKWSLSSKKQLKNIKL